MAKKKAKTKRKAKKKKARKKPKKRVGKRKPKKKALRKKTITKKSIRKRIEPLETSLFEEVTYKCPGCGRPMTVVKISGYDVSGMLCQRCSHGDITTDEGE